MIFDSFVKGRGRIEGGQRGTIWIFRFEEEIQEESEIDYSRHDDARDRDEHFNLLQNGEHQVVLHSNLHSVTFSFRRLQWRQEKTRNRNRSRKCQSANNQKS